MQRSSTADVRRNLTNLEKILLLCAAVFFLAVLAAGIRSRGLGDGYEITTQYRAADSRVAPEAGEKVDLNTAGAAELAELPGIGGVLAQRIVDYRAAHGAFQKPEDIKNVDGIGDGKFSGIKDLITAGEETTP